MTGDYVSRITPLPPKKPLVRDGETYLHHAKIEKEGSCHLFHHALDSHMQDSGADIRYIQQILGHADLSTTQIYTHVSIEKLREIHKATHPAKVEGKK